MPQDIINGAKLTKLASKIGYKIFLWIQILFYEPLNFSENGPLVK